MASKFLLLKLRAAILEYFALT